MRVCVLSVCVWGGGGPTSRRPWVQVDISSLTREMVTPAQRKSLTKEGYKIIGSHSAVKLCRCDVRTVVRGGRGWKRGLVTCVLMLPLPACVLVLVVQVDQKPAARSRGALVAPSLSPPPRPSPAPAPTRCAQ